MVGLGFAGWGVFDAAIKPNVFPKRFGVVEEGRIYRSGELTPAAMRLVHDSRGIKTVVDLGAYEPGSVEERRAERTATLLGMKRVVLRLEGDATGNPNNYVEALRIMTDPAAQPVLVHCSAGTQRTGCAVAMFRMIEEGKTFDEALVEAKRYDHDPLDNPKLTEMIEKWEPSVAEAFRRGGQIPGIEAAVPRVGGAAR